MLSLNNTKKNKQGIQQDLLPKLELISKNLGDSYKATKDESYMLCFTFLKLGLTLAGIGSNLIPSMNTAFYSTEELTE